MVSMYMAAAVAVMVQHVVATPNILFILVDDQGFQDLGYRENTDLKDATPFIDSLAAEGVKLDFHYVQPACTPTRGAFLTGRYAMRLGFQQGVLDSKSDDSLPLTELTLASELQKHGYRTALFGKWHLGSSNWSMVPNQRGFDEYRGYYGGAVPFWSKKSKNFYDMHVNNGIETDPTALADTTYSQYVWQEGLDGFLRDMDVNHPDTPWFIMHAFQTVHTPLEAPEAMQTHPACSLITDADRKMFCAMLLVTDNMVQQTFQTLEDHSYKDNTFVVYSADNGGATAAGASNMPLRGRKGSVFEGGVRAAAWVWGEMLNKEIRGSTFGGMLHLVDWFPTLMSMATDGKWTPEGLPNELDGYNMYDSLTTGAESPRTEVVYNFDSSTTWGSAIRVGEWKLITGQKNQEWFPVPGSASEAVLKKNNNGGTGARDGSSSAGNISEVGMSNGNAVAEAGVQCTGNGGQAKCDYLFHIATDPDETTNLFDSQPERVASLRAKLNAFRTAEAPCNTCGGTDPAAEVEAAKTGFWLPWMGEKPTAASSLLPRTTAAENAHSDTGDGVGVGNEGNSNSNVGEASNRSDDDNGNPESGWAGPAVVAMFVLIAVAAAIAMAAMFVGRHSGTRRDLAGADVHAGGEDGRCSVERRPLLGNVSL